MTTKVVGVTFSNEDGSSRAKIIAGMTESDKVYLERDPYNKYDANAVKVCVLKNGEKKQIGFLSKDIAANISPKLRRNITFNVIIQGVGIWNDRPFCEIEIHESELAKTTSTPSTSSTRVTVGPTFTPNKPMSTPSKPSPTFTPNKTISTQSVPNPTFTPTNQTKHTESNGNHHATPPESSSQQAKSQSSNFGCFGMIIFATIVISALFTL